jgi:hypothetical protein
MGMPAEQGLSVLYVLADQWLRERQMVKGLGAEDPAPLDEMVGRTRLAVQASGGSDRAARVDLARSLGGEVIG